MPKKVDEAELAHHKEQAFQALKDVATVMTLMDEAELKAVRVARKSGASWTEIAAALGVTRQAAWDRWHELDEAP